MAAETRVGHEIAWKRLAPALGVRTVPPYGGTIAPASVRPHLTVSDSASGEHVDRIDLAVASGLPLVARLFEAWLIENRTGRWTTRERFALGDA